MSLLTKWLFYGSTKSNVGRSHLASPTRTRHIGNSSPYKKRSSYKRKRRKW